MTSTERHEARYQRRRAARRARELARAACGGYEEVFSFENLYEAGKQCCKGVRWKASTQRFEASIPTTTQKLRADLMAEKFKGRGFIEFGIWERGHYRWIKSVHITERAVQKCMNTHVLRPLLLPSLIYDNGACQKGKGTDFALDRLEHHLRRHYRKHGREGGILLWDLSQYFDSIPHAVLTKAARRKIVDDRLFKLYEAFVEAFGEVGLGLGSEISQISAVFVASPIDHYPKDTLGIKGDGRYMDDGYIIHESMDVLRKCLAKLRELTEKMGLKLNEKKTKIVRLTRQFRFLKMRIYLSETGAVVRRLARENITKRRRQLRKFKAKIDDAAATENAQHFAEWAPRVDYSPGMIRRDPEDGALYRVNEGQGHTSQEGWNPSRTPALWTKIGDPAEEWPEWAAPTGAHDAYAKDSKTSHNGKKWVSEIDGNVWEPGVYGWVEVIATD